jgi:signal transduction histidine kinase
VHNYTNDDLFAELKFRFELNRSALSELQTVSRELESLNRKLQASEAMKGHFLSNIRNEINNPLTSISGLARHLMTGRCAPEQVPEIAGMIYSEAFDLDFQLRNIFVAAELEAGEAQPEFCNVEIENLLKNTVELLARHLSLKEINVIEAVSSSTSSTLFVSDAQMLQVLLINLLMNAIEFSPVGGTVRVEMQISSARLQISVADHGSGIDPADQKKIFDRFVQMESGTTRTHRGHGLGLSITRALVELLGGEVTVVSAPGAGAKFNIAIPDPQLATPVSLHASDGNFFLFSTDASDEDQVF